jgi:hypothetical protein
MLSEKVCYFTIRIGKKIVRNPKLLVISVELIFRITNGAVPSHAMGLPIFPTTPPIMRSIH